MSDSNEPKLNESFNTGGSGVESAPQVDLESNFQKLLRAHGITEEMLDSYVDSRWCSYIEAYEHFGISRAELNNLNGDVPISYEASVDIGARAVYLSGALDEYLEYTKLGGFDRALDARYVHVLRQQYENIGTNQIIKSQQTHLDKGNESFHKASGSRSMIDAGHNPSEVLSTERKLKKEFFDRFTGPQNEEDRDRLRRKLKSQMKYYGTKSKYELLYKKKKKKYKKKN